LKQKDEKLALFWCDLLHPVLFDEVEPEQIQEFLKELSNKDLVFPGGRLAKPSLSTLRRKLNNFRAGGFDALARKERKDRDQPRSTPPEIIAKAIELKRVWIFWNNLFEWRGQAIRRSGCDQRELPDKPVAPATDRQGVLGTP